MHLPAWYLFPSFMFRASPIAPFIPPLLQSLNSFHISSRPCSSHVWHPPTTPTSTRRPHHLCPEAGSPVMDLPTSTAYPKTPLPPHHFLLQQSGTHPTIPPQATTTVPPPFPRLSTTGQTYIHPTHATSFDSVPAHSLTQPNPATSRRSPPP
jgi:hypothetical protein